MNPDSFKADIPQKKSLGGSRQPRIFPVLNPKDVTGEADRRNAAYYDYKGMNDFFEEWTG